MQDNVTKTSLASLDICISFGLGHAQRHAFASESLHIMTNELLHLKLDLLKKSHQTNFGLSVSLRKEGVWLLYKLACKHRYIVNAS